MRTIKPRLCLAIGTVILSQGIQANSEPVILESESHPQSPSYESVFPDKIIPLNKQLSWKRRFLGNESFNAGETLPPTSPELENLFSVPMADQASNETNADQLDATGIVKQIKASEGKIKIEHSPIDRLGMPAMTMMFRIEDPGQLAGIEKGSEVVFNVENTAAGFSITRLSPAGGDSGGAYDTQGTVKSIRLSQGKIKIEHAPIDRLGMPAMTMMFRIANPEDLKRLEKDMQVEFDVTNGPAGFEITRIRPVKE